MKQHLSISKLILAVLCTAALALAQGGGAPKGPPAPTSVPEPSTIGVYVLGAVLVGTLANRRMNRRR